MLAIARDNCCNILALSSLPLATAAEGEVADEASVQDLVSLVVAQEEPRPTVRTRLGLAFLHSAIHIQFIFTFIFVLIFIK